MEHAEALKVVYSGFDVGDISEDGPDDLEGLDASAAHVANLLSTEPADSMYLSWKLSNLCYLTYLYYKYIEQ